MKPISMETEVFNIEVDNNHNYYVTEDRVLVHNKSISEQHKNDKKDE